jgi:tetratricopeptide (TPR) repeat protein
MSIYDEAQLFIRHGNIQGAIELMLSLEDIDPALASNDVGWQSLCAIAIESGYATEALELCDRAIAQQQRPIHYETRAWARAMQEDYQGAIADLKKAQTMAQEPSRVEKLDQWIVQLEQGENPFGERSIIPLQQRERRNQ